MKSVLHCATPGNSRRARLGMAVTFLALAVVCCCAPIAAAGVDFNAAPENVLISPQGEPFPIDAAVRPTAFYKDLNGYATIKKVYLLVNDSLSP